jgi:predicted naringenin-chalcone synthase
MASSPAILGLGTALPAHRVPQDLACEIVLRATGLAGSEADWVRRIFARAGVAERRTVLGELADGRPAFGGARRPGTAARMEVFRECAGPLAAEAATRALVASGVAARDVTHVVAVTCTGFHAPGIDVELVDRLGLAPGVDRTVVGFMGCYGAFAGLRVARRTVEADPRAVALVVAVELCSLHLRDDRSPGSLVSHALFGDGAGAAVLAARPAAETLLVPGVPATRVADGTRGLMSWTVGDDGFEMSLDAQVSDALGRAVAAFATEIAPPGGVDAWCVHPGGPAILAAAADALRLGEGDLADSRAVLRDVGNVSSATILFVLERAAARMAEGRRGVALGFGPGITIEGFPFTRGGRAK